MPDDLDYETFGRLLEQPEPWTPEHEKTMRFALEQQRALLAGAHPQDRTAQARLRGVLDDIEAAIARRESGGAG